MSSQSKYTDLLDPSTMEHCAIPSATYRLQLHNEFDFDDACAVAAYIANLGVSHLYLSPILVARAGSQHGYDVIDHSRVNPELGGEAALGRLASMCRSVGLGLIIDIVPNHMAVGGSDNLAWFDVLQNGRASKFAPMFDIDFDTMGSADSGKINLPVLGKPYGEILAAGEIVLRWDREIARLVICYGDHRFPITPVDCELILRGQSPETANFSAWHDPTAMHALLERQNYRLTWWRAAGDIINWRRFFDINELIGLRVEDNEVFEATHAVIFRLYAEGVIDGVRVDHIDGLADPAAYTRRLREKLLELNQRRPSGAARGGPYIVVEKILGRHEALESNWPVHGTTGYDFMDEVSALQHDGSGTESLNALWNGISGRPIEFEDEELAAREEILGGAFAGQLAQSAAKLHSIAHASILYRDLTQESFRRALVGIIAHLRVYRSYATGRAGDDALSEAFQFALNTARTALPADAATFDFIILVLSGRCIGTESACVDAVRRLNQLTAPVAAKAVEDTAFYRYGRLLSRNDVGFDVARLALSDDAFLRAGKLRAEVRPLAMLATATHDHKRGEDSRARLAVVSEIAETWAESVSEWFSLTAGERPAEIAEDDAYMLFQALVAAWPFNLSPLDAEGLATFEKRVALWRVKSLREAKLRSSWAVPDEDYESANKNWLRILLDPNRSAEFLESIAAFVARIAGAGAVNGVVQAALRCAWPGVPDLYQGCELWDLSFVDPDNRLPVDYRARIDLLDHRKSDWASGAVKLATISELLRWRRADPELFTHGRLESIETRGRRNANVFAFRRVLGSRAVTVVAMRHIASANIAFGGTPDSAWWAGTEVAFGGGWRLVADIFDGKPVFLSRSTGRVAVSTELEAHS